MDSCPFVSLIISAYNEGDVIEKKLINSLELDYPEEKMEIIVVSESTDSTNAIVRSYADKGIKLFSFEGRKGKAATLFRCVPSANGEIIVFSDANALYRNDAIRKLVRNYNDPRIGCVSGKLVYCATNLSAVGKGEGMYWRYENLVKELESSLFSLLGANGSIFSLRKQLYSPISQDRGDDFELPVMVAQKGYGVVLEKEAISWENASESTIQEFNRKVRIASWNMGAALLMLKSCMGKNKWFLSFQLISHKLLRWFVPLFLIVLFTCNLFIHQHFYRFFLFTQVLFYALALGGFYLDHKKMDVPKIINIAYFFCVVNFAALVGIKVFCSQKQGALWEKLRN